MNKEKGIIRPSKGKNDPSVDSDLLMVMIPTDLKHLAKRCQARKWPRSGPAFYDHYRVEDADQKAITLIGPFLGAPQAVMAMEKMIALGAERIWVLGYCGSLGKDLHIGDLVIPSTALSEEGTSQHYPIGERPLKTDEGLNGLLKEALRVHGQSVTLGPIWTTDAPYRETPAKVEAYLKKGILAVEMEMSALMTLAIYRGVSLTGLLCVSDELHDMKWKPGFSDPKLKKASRIAGDVLLNLVKSLKG